MKDYPGKVRVFFRHNPLPFHQDAPAGLAGGAGRRRPGQVLGDARQAVRQPAEHQAPRPGEVRAGAGPRHGQVQAGARRRAPARRASRPTWRWRRRSACSGTPTFFINGRAGSGAQPYEEFKKVIDEEIAHADKLLAKGTPRHRSTTTLMASAPAPAGAAAGRSPPAPGRPGAGTEVYKVAVGDAADQGRQAAQGHHRRVHRVPVPVLQPRSNPTMNAAGRRTYGNDVQIAFKHQPLPFHNNAEIAGAGRRGGARAGQVLGDARQAVRQPAGARPAQPREVRAGARPRHGASSRPRWTTTRSRSASRRDTDARRPSSAPRGTPTFFINGRKLRRRAAVRGVQERHRRGDQEGRREAEGAASPAASSTPS